MIERKIDSNLHFCYYLSLLVRLFLFRISKSWIHERRNLRVNLWNVPKNPHHSGDIALGVDGTLTVILCSNPTTGFQWSESPEISDPTILQQLDHEFIPAEAENIVGGAGKELFTFKTLKKGAAIIHFEYSRPWEGGEKGEWTFDLEVQVTCPWSATVFDRSLHWRSPPDCGRG